MGWLVFAMLWVVGCVSYPGVEMADLGANPLPATSRRVALGFSNQVVLRQPAGDIPLAAPPVVEGGVLMGSNYFSTVAAVPERADLVVDFRTVVLEQDVEGGAVWLDRGYLALSLLTVGLIPYVSSQPRRLEARVSLGGQEVKRYAFRGDMRYLAWLPALPWMVAKPFEAGWSGLGAARDEVDRVLTTQFLQGLRRDFLPKPAG